MKPLIFALLVCACTNEPSGSGSGGAGSGPEAPLPQPAPVPVPAPEGEGKGGGVYSYQPCNETCPGDCFSVPDGEKNIGVCAAPCQLPTDCPFKENGHSICVDHKCGLSCGTGSCPDAGMKCVNGVCGFPLPAPQ